MNEHPTINDIQLTEQGSKREVLYAIDGGKGLTLDESIRSQINIAANKTISGDGFTFSEEFDTDNLSSLPDYSTVKQWSDKAVAQAKLLIGYAISFLHKLPCSNFASHTLMG